MWLLWKKLIAYILLLGTASYFGIELLPAQQSKAGTNAEQSWNDQVAAALASSPIPSASARPALPTVVPSPTESSAVATMPAASPIPSAAASQTVVSPAPVKARLSINHATWQELTALPGIGETKAKAIVDYRDRHNGFRSIDELQEVKGIGPRTVDKLRSQVSL